jgi:sec-independent protein translocase protein TatB
MFEVGFTELLVIFVLALVVLGPEKLPRLAQQVGRWIGRARAMAKQFREQLEDEVNLADMKKWEQTATKPTPAPEPAPAAHDTATPHTESTSADTPMSHAAPTSEATSAAQDSSLPAGTPENASGASGHNSGPPPEPEAAVYQPPAYATGNGSTAHASSEDASHAVKSPPSHEPVPATDEPPARPGDVITHTHERGI